MRGLIPWGRRGGVNVRRGEDNPFLTLHREILFDDVFHGFDLAPLGSDRFFGRINGNWHWPNIEVNETDKEVKVSAELPSLDVVNGVLAVQLVDLLASPRYWR
jgi:HSP20 family protein